MPLSRFFILVSYAFRDVSKSRIVLVLTVVSLSAAFAAMLLSTSILDGFRQTLVDGAVGWLSHLVIAPSGDRLSIKNVDDVVKALNSIENIESFSIRSYAVASIKYDDRTVIPYRIMGANEFNEGQTTGLPYRIINGEFIKSSKPKNAVFGITLADGVLDEEFDKKMIKIGEKIEVATAKGKTKEYKVSGIIDAKTFLPNLIMILPKKELEKLDDSRKNSEIVVRLKDPDKIEETRELIKNKNLNVSVATWHEKSGFIDDIIIAVSFVTGLISKLMVSSVFLITSIVIFINVLQKRKQLGIIKSMGASNRFVVGIYILEAAIYSVLSYTLGFLIFMLIHFYSGENPNPMLIGDFRTVFSFDNFINSLIILLAASIGGSIVPAYVAAKTNIVDVIRESV
ncbi:ABC transporter permease [Candidatus Wolfebacteria bacterium]|nr:ABC transporter permease [Candidatus Wolfebacteria bacterium]